MTARVGALLALVVVIAAACSDNPSATKPTSTSQPSSGHVLLVGTYRGTKGTYTTIQAAVNAARPGDWILIAPGDYHETADQSSPTSTELSRAESRESS